MTSRDLSPQGVPVVRFEMAVHPEGDRCLPEDGHEFDQGVHGLLRQALAEVERPGPFGEIFLPAVILEAPFIGCRQVDHGAGAFLDRAGNPAVIGVEVSQKDLVDVPCRFSQGGQRLVERLKRFGDVHARVEEGHLAVVHQGMDVHMAEAKGHRQGDPVEIGQDLIDQGFASLQSFRISDRTSYPRRAPGSTQLWSSLAGSA